MNRIVGVMSVCFGPDCAVVEIDRDSGTHAYENVSEYSLGRLGRVVMRLQIKNEALVRPYLAGAAGFVAVIGANPLT